MAIDMSVPRTNESRARVGRRSMMDRGHRHGFISGHYFVICNSVAWFLYGFHPGLHGQLISRTYPRSSPHYAGEI